MKNNEATIFVFFASIIVGLLIAMNISFGGKINFLDVKQYDEAYSERNQLYSELNILKEQFYNTNAKLVKYESGNEKKYQVADEIQKEINYNDLLLGKTDVEGPGVTVTLADGVVNLEEYSSMAQLIHDSDIVEVINDLRSAGAEAISVNGQRIIYDNYGLCAGSNIDLNGVKIVVPFYVSAIGNQDVLYNYLTLESAHVKSLKLRAVKLDITKVDKIKILAYTGNFIYKYMSVTTK
jgi:uncharacterized protein YlxW (UPF0749 family)